MVEWCARAHVRAVSTRTVWRTLSNRAAGEGCLRPARQLGARMWLGGVGVGESNETKQDPKHLLTYPTRD